MAGICLVLAESTLKANLELLRSQAAWIDLAELRADFLPRSEWPGLNEFSRLAGVPLILTLRQPADGGHWQGDQVERQAFFEAALDGAWAMADLEPGQELPEFENRWLDSGRTIIRSFHDFSGVPDNLAERVRQMAGPGIIPKAAVFPQSSLDYLKFLQANAELDHLEEKVVLAMGGFGSSSRILAEKLGSSWTYASPAGKQVAPGHLDPQTLHELYRFSEIGSETPVYGIIGNPVFHSKSPIIHNSGLARAGLPGVYVPFLVDDVPAFLESADYLGVRGLSVTIPHKEVAAGLSLQHSETVQVTGACNTLFRQVSCGAWSKWQGENTDAPGFLAAVTEILGSDLSGRKMTVIGNGGAARGVIHALRSAGAQVLVLGRNREKVEALAAEMGARAGVLDESCLAELSAHADLIVQTTNVGMGDLTGQNPLAFYPWTGKEIAYDIIYVPAHTAFLQAAEAAGCRLIFGSAMLKNQAKLQFKLFTGLDYPGETPEL